MMELFIVWKNNTLNQCNPIYQTFTNVKQIYSGYFLSVILKDDGTLYCLDIIIKFIKHLQILYK